VALGFGIIAAGTALARPALGRTFGRAWEVQAIGAAIAAIGWLVAVA
jgi:hypothetical protein